jgi:hypothetical protein
VDHSGRKILNRVGNTDRGTKRRFSESETRPQLLPSPQQGEEPREVAAVEDETTFLHRDTTTKRQLHCNENHIYVFLFWELRGVSPNFHIHVSVSDLYIFPEMVHIFSCSRIGRSIMGIYK